MVEIVVGFREIRVDVAADAIAEVRGAPQAATIRFSGRVESRAVRATRSDDGFACFAAARVRVRFQFAKGDVARVDASREFALLKNM